jgi:AcrR family transcriptional regulator
MGRRPFVRERILEAAFDLVARRGYEAVSSREIAAAAGVGHASMYRHFASMEALGQELYRVALAPLAVDLEALLERGLRPAALLPELVALVYGWYDRRPRALALLVFPPHDFMPAELAPGNAASIRNRAIVALGLDEDAGALVWGALTGPVLDRYLRRRGGTLAPLAAAHAGRLLALLNDGARKRQGDA